MKKDTAEPKLSKGQLDELTLEQDLEHQLGQSFDSLRNIRLTWDDKEAMLVSRSNDSLSTGTKSQVNDPRLATIVIERAARVMGQLPTGKVQAMSEDDLGKNQLMNLILEKYIYPNAKSQFDLLTKLRMWDIYSHVYGSMPMLVDWVISDEYIGPDCTLIPIRNFFPQPGRISIHESDYVFVKSVVSVDWLSKRKGFKNWKGANLDYVIAQAKKGGKDQGSQDMNKRSFVERDRFTYVPGGTGKSALVELMTRYEKDRWVTFAPDFENKILRDIPNPHQNHRIPIVLKHSFPLIDSMIGLGEFERGKTLQYAINSLINLYMDGVKMSIFPPIMMQADGVVPSTIRISPAAKWLLTKPNAISTFQVSPEGINTFQSTYSFLNAALLNQAGTTDTTVTAKTDPGMGKTPEAIQMLGQRESSRDNWDRFMMEKSLEEVFDIMIDLVATKQEKPIEIGLFKGEIEDIIKDNPDVKQLLKVFKSGNYGKLTISKGKLSNTPYKYYIDAGTSKQQDDTQSQQVLQTLLALFEKDPTIEQKMLQSDKPMVIQWGELFNSIVNTSGLSNAGKIVKELTPQEAQQKMQAQQQQAQQASQPQQQPQAPKQIVNYKDAPDDIKRQMEQADGYQPSQQTTTLPSEALLSHKMAELGQNPPPMQNPAQQMAQAQMQAMPQVMGQGMPQQAQGMPVGQQQQMPQFKDPDIQKLAQSIIGKH